MNKLIVTRVLAVLMLSMLLHACSNNDNTQSAESNSSKETAKYIKGISAASLYEPLKQKGFKIDKQFGGDVFFVDCDKSSSNFNEHVRIAGDSPTNILEIRASYMNYSGGNTDVLATEFLGFISTLPYDDAIPEQARKWVQENISRNSKTEISGVTFEIFGNNKNARTLIITPSN